MDRRLGGNLRKSGGRHRGLQSTAKVSRNKKKCERENPGFEIESASRKQYTGEIASAKQQSLRKRRKGLEDRVVSYGESVKRRRMQAAEALATETGEERLSISQRRKLVARQEKERRSEKNCGWFKFDRQCGALYNELTQSQKRQENVEAKCQEFLDLVFGQESPIMKLHAENDAEQLRAMFCRNSICRGLQHCLKHGTSEMRRLIEGKLIENFANMAQSAAGRHLCMKMILYSPGKKNSLIKFAGPLFKAPRSFFTKYGSTVWDYLLRRMDNKAYLRHAMLIKLFLARLAVLEVPNTEGLTFREVTAKVSPQLLKTLRDHLIESVDRLVKKELLSSDLVHYFLAELCASDSVFAKDSDFLTALAESTFDGAHQLLRSKEGVEALCCLVGLWSAKQKKKFLQNMKAQTALEQTNWATYLLNSVDAVFVCRLLLVTDDTRLAGEAVLGSAFGWQRGRDGAVALKNKEQLIQLLRHEKPLSVFLRLLCPKDAGQFFVPHEMAALAQPAPASKKEELVKLQELTQGYLLPVLRLVDWENDLPKEEIHKLSIKSQRALERIRDIVEQSADIGAGKPPMMSSTGEEKAASEGRESEETITAEIEKESGEEEEDGSASASTQ